MDRVYTIRTPEMVRFDFRLAGPGSRFLAWTIDMIVMAATIVAFLLAGCIVSSLIAVSVQSEIGFAVVIIGVFLIYYGYFAFLEWRWSGKTVGKRFVGLRVIQDNGTRIAPFQAIARNLFRIVDSLAPFYTIGIGAVLASQRSQRLGDMIAGTIVVREDREAVLPKAALLKDDAQSRLFEDKALARKMSRRLTKDERELLVDSARRADEIDLDVRGRLFQRLAAHFAARLELARDPHISDEKLVQNLARGLLAHERGPARGAPAAAAVKTSTGTTTTNTTTTASSQNDIAGGT